MGQRITGSELDKIIDWYLFHEKEIKRAVFETKKDPGDFEVLEKSKKPTEAEAVRDASKLPLVVLDNGVRVTQPEEWLEVIRNTYKGLKNFDREIAVTRYRKHIDYKRHCAMNRYMTKYVYYSAVARVRSYAAVCAAQAGVLRVY